jgi:hypothetical protein
LDGNIVNLATFDKSNRHLLKCYFKHSRQEIQPLISEFIDINNGTKAHNHIGYYIRSENYDYIHTFRKAPQVFKSDAIRMIDYRNKNAPDFIWQSEIGSFLKLISNNSNNQIKQLELAQVILCCGMEIFFDSSL